MRADRPSLQLVMATTNPGKLVELRRLVLAALDADLAARLEVVGLDAVGCPPGKEDGATYEDNARRKLAAVPPGAGRAVVSDDSGIEVDALDGAPGLHSARFALGPAGQALAGPQLNAALLERLAAVPPPRRGARMVSVVALRLPDGRVVFGQGEVRGFIAPDQRGGGGFGYDRVFLLADGRRLSEQPATLKDALGHRGQAVRAVVPAIAAWLGH